MKTKKLLTLTFASILACTMMGCSSSNTNNDTTTNDVIETTTEVASDTTQDTFLDGYLMNKYSSNLEEGKADIKIGGATFKAYEATDGKYVLKYRMYVPSGAESKKDLPVLLFMHGAGERGDDNLAQINTYTGQQTIFAEGSKALEGIIICPQCPTDEKWVDFNASVGGDAIPVYSTDEIEETKPLKTVLKTLKYINSTYSIDRNRIYAMGMSMGGFATWDMLVRHNDIIAAAIPICGGADVSKAEVVKNTPIRTYHGAVDPLVSVEGTRKMVEALTNLGSSIEYTEYPEDGHDIWNKVMEIEGQMDWLYSKTHY